jgi:hypothetical protein
VSERAQVASTVDNAHQLDALEMTSDRAIDAYVSAYLTAAANSADDGVRLRAAQLLVQVHH